MAQMSEKVSASAVDTNEALAKITFKGFNYVCFNLGCKMQDIIF